MLDAIKRWISGGSQDTHWSDVAAWAQRQGHGFKRARDHDGFVIDGVIDGWSWRLEWGPPQRSYIGANELRLRIELRLSSNLQMLVLSRPLMEMLERETFERFTESNQTSIDFSTPEEMRWLAMFPKANLPTLSKELRTRFAAVSSDPELAEQWVDATLAQRLTEASSRLLRREPPFVLMTLRGRVYMRLEFAHPEPAGIAQAVTLFEAAVHSALRVAGNSQEPPADWPSTSSTAWSTDLLPEDRKR
jgi:hypothetical protein